MSIARVALDVPLDEAFDFRVEDASQAPLGALVVVPFGRARKVGVVVEHAARSSLAPGRLKPIERCIDDVPALGAADLRLLKFCAEYYQRPLGEVIAAALPPRFRQVNRRRLAPPASPATQWRFEEKVALNEEQARALAECSAGDGFHPVLLRGVTGSGKTEVYLRLIARQLERQRQALMLVPEIGLTPQLEQSVRDRFPGASVVVTHSNLAQGERAAAWLAAQSGAAQIVLGTRLAAFMPFRALGLIVVDEEHDPSYKQQEGLRYSARDVAVRRAHDLAIPVILGSATPSLETMRNAREGRYRLATLSRRAVGGATLPAIRVVDTAADRPRDGLSSALAAAIARRLERGEQSLVFVNRRGFAPVLHCRACAWHSTCTRCSANLVVHLRARELRCHHCGHRERIPAACPNCGSQDLAAVGQGTQRVEETLRERFPGARIERVDRDSTARKGAMKSLLDRVGAGEIDVLVGTQMLAKGHDYPRLTLVGVLDSDSSLFSADFRAAERLYALLMQVAGRAGRAGLAGEVLIQTDFPSHPLYAAVAANDYEGFAVDALEERRAAEFPPYSHLALLRAEAKGAGEADAFLRRAARLARGMAGPSVEVFDPVAPPMARRAGFERSQLLARSRSRPALQRFLSEWRAALASADARRVRWSLDVDPQEV